MGTKDVLRSWRFTYGNLHGYHRLTICVWERSLDTWHRSLGCGSDDLLLRYCFQRYMGRRFQGLRLRDSTKQDTRRRDKSVSFRELGAFFRALHLTSSFLDLLIPF